MDGGDEEGKEDEDAVGADAENESASGSGEDVGVLSDPDLVVVSDVDGESEYLTDVNMILASGCCNFMNFTILK